MVVDGEDANAAQRSGDDRVIRHHGWSFFGV
jgi:hypothetical protein